MIVTLIHVTSRHTYVELRVHDVDDASQHNDEVEHVPRVRKVVLWRHARARHNTRVSTQQWERRENRNAQWELIRLNMRARMRLCTGYTQHEQTMCWVHVGASTSYCNVQELLTAPPNNRIYFRKKYSIWWLFLSGLRKYESTTSYTSTGSLIGMSG